MDRLSNEILEIIIKLILFGLIFIFFPLKKSITQSKKSLEDLNKEFKWFTIISTLFVFADLVIFSIAFGYLFYGIFSIENEKNSTAIIAVYPDVWSWITCGLALSLGVTYKTSVWLTKKLLKDKFTDFIAMQNMKLGYDGYRLMQIISPLLILLSFLMVMITSGSSTVLYNDRIEVDYYFSFSKKVYQYTDVVRIKEIEGESKNRFEITFNDGKVWNSAQNGFSDYYKDLEIVDIIEEKTSDEIWEE